MYLFSCFGIVLSLQRIRNSFSTVDSEEFLCFVGFAGDVEETILLASVGGGRETELTSTHAHPPPRPTPKEHWLFFKGLVYINMVFTQAYV